MPEEPAGRGDAGGLRWRFTAAGRCDGIIFPPTDRPPGAATWRRWRS